jgi:hypothetical protein
MWNACSNVKAAALGDGKIVVPDLASRYFPDHITGQHQPPHRFTRWSSASYGKQIIFNVGWAAFNAANIVAHKRSNWQLAISS